MLAQVIVPAGKDGLVLGEGDGEAVGVGGQEEDAAITIKQSGLGLGDRAMEMDIRTSHHRIRDRHVNRAGDVELDGAILQRRQRMHPFANAFKWNALPEKQNFKLASVRKDGWIIATQCTLLCLGTLVASGMTCSLSSDMQLILGHTGFCQQVARPCGIHDDRIRKVDLFVPGIKVCRRGFLMRVKIATLLRDPTDCFWSRINLPEHASCAMTLGFAKQPAGAVAEGKDRGRSNAIRADIRQGAS
jgi:hypothetical protein